MPPFSTSLRTFFYFIFPENLYIEGHFIVFEAGFLVMCTVMCIWELFGVQLIQISLKRLGIHNMETRDSSPSVLEVALWYVKRLGSVQTEGYANVYRIHR